MTWNSNDTKPNKADVDAPLPPITRQFFMNQVIDLERSFAPKFKVAKYKGERNMVFGGYSESMNDLQRTLNSKIQAINKRCIAYQFESLIAEEEEVQPLTLKPEQVSDLKGVNVSIEIDSPGMMAALELPRALFIITYDLFINIVGECLSVARVLFSLIIQDFCVTWAETSKGEQHVIRQNYINNLLYI